MIPDRKQQIATQMQKAALDGLVCALPKHVLLLSGYWPVVGTSMAVARSNGEVCLIVPEDEKPFAAKSRATNIETFKPSSLDKITTAEETVVQPLSHTLKLLLNSEPRIGYELGADTQPASYAAMHLYQGSIPEIIRRALPSANIIPADNLLRNLCAIKSAEEIGSIETACRIAARGFAWAAEVLRSGLTEVEAAAELRKLFAAALQDFPDVERAEAFVFVMSGTNSAKASGAFAHSSTRRIETGDLILVHCNSFANGYCTDITRTFSLGELDDKRRAMYEAIFAAREAALKTIAPGVKAADVDRAARAVLRERGFGSDFKHSTGHGVGFGAISPNAPPRIHPQSEDVLQPGMVFNVEPAIYLEDYGGMRHCDMVAVTETGFRLLTPFQSQINELTLGAPRQKSAQAYNS